MPTLPLLAGEGMTVREIDVIARSYGFAPTQDAKAADVILLAKPDREKMERLLAGSPPYALIEYPTPGSSFGGRLHKAIAKHGLFLSLSTATAFSSDMTGLLCSFCARQVNLNEDRRYDIETAVEEALSNAMVHGNLDIASVLRNDPADFELYCDLVNERLTTPDYGGKRIEVLMTWENACLEVEVHDEGRGYDISNLNALPQVEAKCGRGFSLIRELSSSVSVGEYGRSLTMRFGQ